MPKYRMLMVDGGWLELVKTHQDMANDRRYVLEHRKCDRNAKNASKWRDGKNRNARWAT